MGTKNRQPSETSCLWCGKKLHRADLEKHYLDAHQNARTKKSHQEGQTES